ncbi:hypothetical protein [Erythrobacter sp. THAF29]|uniref:hypothetical protein n=1 Tax=Erythrobacter sp. THAF29 TaxID=2587851 RepID=UPI001268CCA3|nr:hypothetical protein [Erythrobacter sp. THAF29]QFT77872.1 hypothetical protein FIU90_10025 [Erythrobacter sp. THAF29]
MPEDDKPHYPNPREEDIVYGDRRISRPDASLPDWEMPDTAYRPIPIVWFTGAFLPHLFISGVLLAILSFDRWPSFVLSSVVAAVLWKWTWDRGMKTAASGWKVATVAMLLFQLLFIYAVTDPGFG